MKRYRAQLVIATLTLPLASFTLGAHDGHDHGRKSEAAHAQREQIANRPFSAPAPIAIKLFQYQPERLQVTPGTTVTWVNEDEIFHSVSSDNKEQGFHGDLDGKRKIFSFTFAQPGTYTYHCERHEHMRGEIEVR